jgi:hypothetical protein
MVTLIAPDLHFRVWKNNFVAQIFFKFPIFWIPYIKDYTPRLTKILQHVPFKIHQAHIDMDFDEFLNLYIS